MIAQHPLQGILGCLCVASMTPAFAATPGLPRAEQSRCDVLNIEANSANCDARACVLRGKVQLACETMRLWADEVHLAVNADRSFGGATAAGNVVFTQGQTMLTCNRLQLDADRVRGRIDGATLAFNRGGTGIDSAHGATLHGNMERLDENTFVIHGGDFTLCDCGDAPPSWLLTASEIEAVRGERATVWWPQLYLAPMGFGPIPVTPPLPPISLPLTQRAMGFLPPVVSFLQIPWPVLDLPFFIPLGDSWDLLLTPGLRSDWATHRVRSRPLVLASWTSPRLGGRVRYAPSQHSDGTFSWEWTRDLAYGAAEQARAQDALQTAERARGLSDRVALSWISRNRISERLDWTVDAQWFSDDLYLADFRIPAEERVAAFVPSRSQLLWRGDEWVASLRADYFLRLDNANAERPPHNWDGQERGVLHLGPTATLSLLPTHLAGPLYADMTFFFSRLGPWSDAQSPELYRGARVGVTLMDALGSLQLRTAAYSDTFWATGSHGETFFNTMLQVDATLQMEAVGRFGDLLHVVSPGIDLRAVPWLWTAPHNADLDSLQAYPEAQRGQLYQAVPRLEQSLLRTDEEAGTQVPLATLALRLPLDLSRGRLLQGRIVLDVPLGHILGTSLAAGLDPSPTPPASGRFRELNTNVRFILAPAALDLTYVRTAPDAERLVRSVYELAASNPTPASHWVHYVSTAMRLGLGSAFSASYTGAYILPQPGQVGGHPGCGAADDPRLPRSCFVAHHITLAYSSPCKCWSVSVNASLPAQANQKPRLGITFDLASVATAAPSPLAQSPIPPEG